jgi:hypothetical protein
MPAPRDAAGRPRKDRDGRGRRRSEGRHFDPVQVQIRGSLAWLVRAYLDDLEARNYSPATIRTRREMCLQFVEWCAERDVAQASAVSRPLIERYQRHLFVLRTASGKALSVNYQIQRLAAVQFLFRWAVRRSLMKSGLSWLFRTWPRPWACEIGPFWKRCIPPASAGLNAQP